MLRFKHSLVKASDDSSRLGRCNARGLDGDPVGRAGPAYNLMS